MKTKLICAAAAAASILTFSSLATAQERLMDGVMGAGAGAIVGGPVGAVAGGVTGYVAGPNIATAIGARPRYRRYRDRAVVRREEPYRYTVGGYEW